ncbi:ABC transporter permease [Bdellovibrio bacteriovorus]|uniref:ABC transporter permease n=1 Tax=Bdellovibrio bacteriovorus TaxID=959 RepID=A0A162GMG6_BDEBC|nr:ABC transporter permease [Bdellovibrio bacteriovorus]KYG68503.1 ABC transporter permease [Bdellovibrio bacteriovorus]
MNSINTPLTAFMLEILRFVGGVGLLSADVFKQIFKGRFYWKLLVEQIYQIGIRSMPLIIVTAVSIGMVMSLQFGLGLEKFGGKLYVPKLLAVTILREIGPVFTSLMLAARVGAGIASEIGSMVVTQQIDAIRALGTSPIKKIVIPRVLACLIVLPILVSIANIVGNAGGLLVGATELNLDPNFYLLKVITTSSMQDYLSGFGKTFFFALFIAIPSCYFGLNVKEGTKEVGIATTKAVVVSSILILVGDFFLSKLFWIVEKL